MFNFTCNDCGSSKLGHQKWIGSCSPIKIYDNNHIEYEQAEIDEDNELGGADGFICMDCKDELYFCGCRIHTENELISYLSLDPEKRQEQEKFYQETLEAEIDRDLEEQKMINESYFALNDEVITK